MGNQETSILRSRNLRQISAPRKISTRSSRATDALVPFRWDISHKHKLGGLLNGERAITCNGFLTHLLACSARVVALSGDADLVFVGRSPESIHDLLLGILWETSWHDRMTLLHYSVGYTETAVKCRRRPDTLGAFRRYLDELGLSPTKLTVRERPVAFVDLVCSGRTIHQLLQLLHDWVQEENADWHALQRKIRVVAIVRPEAPSPVAQWKRRAKPWLWRDHAPWIAQLLERGALKETPLDRQVWSFLGDHQDKTTRSYTPDHWGDAAFTLPCHKNEKHLQALRSARWLFEEGRQRARREEFAVLLANEWEMRGSWLRSLIQEVRGAKSARGRYVTS